MSLRYLVAAFKTRVGNPTRKLVLLKLADNANDAGICWPSLSRIAEDTELSRDTVRRSIADLAAAGLVSIQKREQDGVNLPSFYHLHLECEWGGSSTVLPPLAQCKGVVAQCEGGSSTVLPEPLSEPVSEPQQQHARARVRARAVPAADAAAAFMPGKRRRARASGIVTWTPEDEDAAARIEAETDQAEVARAVQAVRDAGREPVPGLVSREIESTRRRQEAEARRAAREGQIERAAALQADPSAAARGRALLERIRARRQGREAVEC